MKEKNEKGFNVCREMLFLPAVKDINNEQRKLLMFLNDYQLKYAKSKNEPFIVTAEKMKEWYDLTGLEFLPAVEGLKKTGFIAYEYANIENTELKVTFDWDCIMKKIREGIYVR